MAAYLEGKRILVTGGTGLIGIPLARKLQQIGAKVRVASLDSHNPFDDGIEFVRGDLCNEEFCAASMKDIQVVFHLAGIKGGIGVARTKASTFLLKNVLMNIQVMEAARKADVERLLFTSSICIYPPAEVFREDQAFTGLPDQSDRYGAISKLVGEMQIEAYRLQYELEGLLIARPTNTYGPYDNFDPESALIVPALIHRALNGENPLVVWGDGSTVREFAYSEDAADALITITEKNAPGPYNVGSGEAVSISEVAGLVAKHASELMGTPVKVEWDTTKPTGEKYRVASIDKLRSELGWSPGVSLSEGIRRTMEWYRDNRETNLGRYSILSED
ncbi:MAG: NAD-dependent epimerase/dehydratase family protein [Planctomycetota bacterium]|jgi:GDP-L-fucose synthase